MSATQNPMSITVCLVEDDRAFRTRLEECLAQAEGFRCAGSYSDAESGLPGIIESNPNVAVIDMGLPKMQGAELIQRLKKKAPYVRTLVLTGIPTDEIVFEALVAGADGFVDKGPYRFRLRDFLSEIRDVHGGLTPLSERARRLLIGVSRRFTTPKSLSKAPLTSREREIILLVKDGLPDKRIADLLGISIHTVQTHQKRIHAKLGAHSRLEAALKAFSMD